MSHKLVLTLDKCNSLKKPLIGLWSTFEVVQGKPILPSDNPYAIQRQCSKKNKLVKSGYILVTVYDGNSMD